MTWRWSLSNMASITSKSSRLRLVVKLLVAMVILIAVSRVFHAEVEHWARHRAPEIKVCDNVAHTVELNQSLAGVARVDERAGHMPPVAKETNVAPESSRFYHAALPVADHAALPVADHAALPEADHASLPVADHAALPAGDHASLPVGDHASLPVGDHASLPVADHAALPEGDHAALPAGDHASLPVGDYAFLQIDNHDAWIYSAHFDTHPENASRTLVRVFGIARYTRDPVFCHFVNDGHGVTSGQGQRRFIRDAHSRRYVSAFFDCPVSSLTSPKLVSVTYSDTDQPKHWLQIEYPKPLTRNFTVCYAALFNYNRTTQLIISIEINRALGAQHFYVYNYTVSSTTDTVLRYYQDLGLLTVMQWPLPTLEIWYYAQNMAINDCVYRNRLTSRYVVIQDTDEFIIPKQHGSWAEVLQAAEAQFYQQPNITASTPLGSFSVETSYFHDMPSAAVWRDLMTNYSITSEEEKFLTDNRVIPFLYVQRKNVIYKYASRTKTIVRPEHVFNSGIHFTHSHRGKATHTVVSNDLALVHHYKKVGVHPVLDPAVLRLKPTIVPALMKTFQVLSHLWL